MRLFKKKERQLLVRIAIVDGKHTFRFTIADSNIREVFDMFERIIAANEVPEKGTLTMVSMREINGHENGRFKSIKTNHIYAIVLNNLIKNEIKYNNATNIKPIKDSWNREEVTNSIKLAVMSLYRHLSSKEVNGLDELEYDWCDKWIEENL